MHRLLIVLTALLCTTWLSIGHARPDLPAQAALAPVQTAAAYLEQANHSSSPTRETLLLKAADRYLIEEHPERAAQLLEHLPPQVLSPIQRMQRNIVTARLRLAQHQPDAAIEVLLNLPTLLPSDIQREKQYLLALAYRLQGNWMTSTQQLIQLDPYLKSPLDRLSNHRQIWHNLQQMPLNSLDSQRQSLPIGVTKGWVDLAYLFRFNKNNLAQRQLDLTQWHADYPSHPAESLLHPPAPATPAAHLAATPTLTVQTQPETDAPQRPLNIGVLLPLTGPMANSAEAIEKGFLAAYYQAKKQGTPPNLNFYNTHTGVLAAYQRAVDEKADVIVGPLLKNNVQNLLNSARLDRPTLSLNYAPNVKRGFANVYQFALSPQDEVQQAAMRAWQAHHANAMIISSNTAWGRHAAGTFRNTWTKQGGNISADFHFESGKHIAKQLRGTLGIAGSKQRARDLRRVIRRSFEFVPRRRQDFDVIFLAATPDQARQIVPLLKYYFAGHIPVYATSAVFSGDMQQQSDLNNVMFCDMPWILDPSQAISEQRKQIATVWPKAYRRNPRLFAFGMDAYTLATQIQSLPGQPNLSGYTGELMVDNEGKVHRQLMWAVVKDGQVHLLQHER